MYYNEDGFNSATDISGRLNRMAKFHQQILGEITFYF